MSGGVPEMLAVAGTALMAFAIFGPFRKPAEADHSPPAAEPVASEEPWPALVAATALGCDAPARIDLADALGTVRSVWAANILHQAYETETDPAVRSAIASALSSSQSLVT